MLKKLILIVVCLCLGLSFGAEIPKEKQAQYKKEIEIFAALKYPELKKNIDKDYEQAKLLYKKLNLSTSDKEKGAYSEKLEFKASSIDSGIFWYYMDLLNITEKYIKIRDKVPSSDNLADIYDALQPCFMSANVDTSETQKIYRYGREKAIIIQKWAGFVD